MKQKPEHTLDGDVEQSEEFLRRVYSDEALRLSDVEWLAHANRVRAELELKRSQQ